MPQRFRTRLALGMLAAMAMSAGTDAWRRRAAPSSSESFSVSCTGCRRRPCCRPRRRSPATSGSPGFRISHGRDGRPWPRPDGRRRRAPAAPRHHPHAPDGGRRLGRRGADPPVRAPLWQFTITATDANRFVASARPRSPAAEGRRPRPLLPRLGRRDVRDARRRRARRRRSAARRPAGRPRRDDPGRRRSTTSTRLERGPRRSATSPRC